MPKPTREEKDRMIYAMELDKRSPQELARIAQGHRRIAEALGHPKGQTIVAEAAQEVADRKRQNGEES